MISNILKLASAAALGLALAGGAYAQSKMSDDKGGAMSKTSSDKMSSDKMSSDKMSKDSMSKDKMSKDGMSKDKMSK